MSSELDFGLGMSVVPPRNWVLEYVLSSHRYLMCLRKPVSQSEWLPLQYAIVVMYLDDGSVSYHMYQPLRPLSQRGELTSSFEDLTRALRAIRQRQGHNLVVPGEFDLSTNCVSFACFCSAPTTLRTLSRMTNGPLTPPIVLYRILGVTEIMRGSMMSGMVAVLSDSGVGGVSLERRSWAAIGVLLRGLIVTKLEVEVGGSSDRAGSASAAYDGLHLGDRLSLSLLSRLVVDIYTLHVHMKYCLVQVLITCAKVLPFPMGSEGFSSQNSIAIAPL